MRNYDGNIRRDTARRGPLIVINSLSCNSLSCDAADITADDNFGTALESNVMISSATVLKDSTNRYGNVQSKKGKQVDVATLAKRWGISPGKAKHTVLKTTQRGVRSTLHPALSRRYPTNDCMLWYDHLPHQLFTDTIFAAKDQPSWWRKNTCAQVYTASHGVVLMQWNTRVMPTRVFLSSFTVMEFHRRWYLMEPRRKFVANSRRSVGRG